MRIKTGGHVVWGVGAKPGTTGLPGTWRTTFPDGQWLETTFDEFGHYGFEWDDGLTGDGCYTATTAELTIYERRATVDRIGNQITFVTDSGVFTGTYIIQGDRMEIGFPDRTVIYTRL